MDANKLFERAIQASERGTHDYAIELFQQLLTIQPDMVKARRELRSVERRRVQENGGMNAVVKVLGGIKGFLPFAKAMIYGVTQSHERRMIACEKYLQNDPENGMMLSSLAASAARSNYVDTAVLVYEDLKEINSENIKALRSLARLYQKKGDIDKASECFEKILQSKPTDEEAGKAVNDLAALKTMKDGRWNEAGEKGGYRKMLRDQEKSVELEQEQHISRSEEDYAARIARVKRDLEKTPRDVKILTQLADLYERSDDREEARATYMKIKDIDKGNLVADRKLSDLDIDEKKDAIRELETRVKENPDDEALKVELEKAITEQRSFQIEQLNTLAAAAPTDNSLKYRLGFALYENGDVDIAIQQFQQSTKDPKHRRNSHKMLGFCFQNKGMFDMAADQFNDALKDTSATSNEAKEIIYQIGICYENENKIDKAEEAFKRIYAVDIGYKDVSQKMESFYNR